MDIASLLLNRLSLTNYLGKDNQGFTPLIDLSTLQASNLAAQRGQIFENQNSAVQLDLSPEAQEILKQQNEEKGTSEQIKGAQQHFIQFFEENGVDLGNLSFEAEDLLVSILEVIENTGSTNRDTVVNQLESEASKGTRQVYTLLSDNRRLRIAVEKQENGENTLTITDIFGSKADVAKITLEHGENEDITINVERKQEVFAHGRRVGTEGQETLTIKT